jgi:hypothetical protein
VGWYQVVKTIKGHRYVYQQRTWREGKHVRTESRYVGPADPEERAGSSPSPQLTLHTTPEKETPGSGELDPDNVGKAFTLLTQAVPSGTFVLPWLDVPNEKDLVEKSKEIDHCISALNIHITRRKKGAFYDRELDILNTPPKRHFVKTKYETPTQAYYTSLFSRSGALDRWSNAAKLTRT